MFQTINTFIVPHGLLNYDWATRACDELSGPILFEPVGAGATEVCRQAVKIQNGQRDKMGAGKACGLVG